jgi:hypothetical protein
MTTIDRATEGTHLVQENKLPIGYIPTVILSSRAASHNNIFAFHAELITNTEIKHKRGTINDKRSPSLP